jgi:hypothetical protein
MNTVPGSTPGCVCLEETVKNKIIINTDQLYHVLLFQCFWIQETKIISRILFFISYGVRLRLRTAATNGHIVDTPDYIWVWRTTVEWYWQRKTEELRGKPVAVQLCPHQIPRGLTRARTRDSEVRGRRLTAWAMARPSINRNYKVKLSHNTPTEALGGRGYIVLTHSRPRH